jgi:hypothetical protein
MCNVTSSGVEKSFQGKLLGAGVLDSARTDRRCIAPISQGLFCSRPPVLCPPRFYVTRTSARVITPVSLIDLRGHVHLHPTVPGVLPARHRRHRTPGYMTLPRWGRNQSRSTPRSLFGIPLRVLISKTATLQGDACPRFRGLEHRLNDGERAECVCGGDGQLFAIQ